MSRTLCPTCPELSVQSGTGQPDRHDAPFRGCLSGACPALSEDEKRTKGRIDLWRGSFGAKAAHLYAEDRPDGSRVLTLRCSCGTTRVTAAPWDEDAAARLFADHRRASPLCRHLPSHRRAARYRSVERPGTAVVA